jgi:hypothetical protein
VNRFRWAALVFAILAIVSFVAAIWAPSPVVQGELGGTGGLLLGCCAVSFLVWFFYWVEND